MKCSNINEFSLIDIWASGIERFPTHFAAVVGEPAWKRRFFISDPDGSKDFQPSTRLPCFQKWAWSIMYSFYLIFNLDSSRIIFSLFPPRLLYARPDNSSQTFPDSLLFPSLCCFETLHIFEPCVQVQHRRNENLSVLRRRDSASEAWICHASVPWVPCHVMQELQEPFRRSNPCWHEFGRHSGLLQRSRQGSLALVLCGAMLCGVAIVLSI